MSEPLVQEEKRPEPPVVAVLVPVIVSMTVAQAAEYAEWYGLEKVSGSADGGVTTEGGGAAEGIDDLKERSLAEAVQEALTAEGTGDALWGLVTVTVLGEEIVPVGEPFPDWEEGFVTGLDGHRVARSEWAAGFRTCEHCHGVTSNG